ncbi:MAG TPA: helix-turn-helix domain-containing protein [Desulfosporosinus sp.]|nr:helix-turn-helix domain-containing protein [Desulfosporosinus sp.]
MYSQEKVNIALKLYHQCESVTKTVQILGYPTRKALYGWIHDESKPKQQRKILELINNKTHPRNPTVGVKMDALHRCFVLGERIKLVLEDIDYTRVSIYAWRKSIFRRGRLHW